MKSLVKVIVLLFAGSVLLYLGELATRTEGFSHPTAIAASTFVGCLIFANIGIIAAASLFHFDREGHRAPWLLLAALPLCGLFWFLAGGWLLLS